MFRFYQKIELKGASTNISYVKQEISSNRLTKKNLKQNCEMINEQIQKDLVKW